MLWKCRHNFKSEASFYGESVTLEKSMICFMLLIQPFFEYDVSESNFNVTEGILSLGYEIRR